MQPGFFGLSLGPDQNGVSVNDVMVMMPNYTVLSISSHSVPATANPALPKTFPAQTPGLSNHSGWL